MEDKYYSRYYVYKHRNKNLVAPVKDKAGDEDSKLSRALQDAVKSRNLPKSCPKCRGILEYLGLGHYTCTDCKEDVYTDYGKVRKVIDEHGTMKVDDVCELTGLTKRDIRRLVDEGSIVIVSGMIGIY